MKNLKINSLLIAFIVIIFSSCNKEYHDTPPSQFVIKKVILRNGMKKMTTYKVLMLDASGIGETSFIMVDSINKYKVGDVLSLQLVH
jgi:hypothetical protein